MNTRIPYTLGLAGAAAVLVMAAGCGHGHGADCPSGVCAPKPSAQAPASAPTPAAVKAEPAEINTAALLAMQRAGVRMQLLEARAGTKDLIPGARVLAQDAPEAEILAALPDKAGRYVTYCGSAKCGASGKLAGRLTALGYGNVLEFRDGWAGWSDHLAGKELTRAELNAPALRVLLASGADLRVFDARSGKYDDGRRVPGAGSLDAQSSLEKVAGELPRKEQLAITYCTNTKCPASDMLARHLTKLGYANVIEFPQGIEGWASAGYEVKQQGK